MINYIVFLKTVEDDAMTDEVEIRLNFCTKVQSWYSINKQNLNVDYNIDTDDTSIDTR
jgi:hypothetical protein